MIKVERLVKRYGEVTALDDLSFHIKKGEICGFLGPNGAGKTSTMRILTGYMPPTAGSVTIAGLDIFDNLIDIKKRIGYLPESNPLYGDMRVEEYLSFAAQIKGLFGNAKKKAVGEAMEHTQISDRRRSLIGTLSKGLKQRVGLAQALLNDPEILILDEPTIGLDPKQISDIRSLIRDLAGKRTVILSSHILPEVSAICSRVMIINDGKLLAADTPENLGASFQEKGAVTVKIKGPEDKVLSSIQNLTETANVSSSVFASGITALKVTPHENMNLRKAIVKLIAENDWELFGFSESTLSLEEVYIKLIAGESPKTGAVEESQ